MSTLILFIIIIALSYLAAVAYRIIKILFKEVKQNGIYKRKKRRT